MAKRENEQRKNRTVALGSILDSVLQRYHLADGILVSRILAEKETVFGSFGTHIKGVEYPVITTDGRARYQVMRIQFDSDAWRQEAQLCQKELLERLAEIAPGKVKKLYFV